MELHQYLQTAQAFDCTGQVTHTLTLRVDGTVAVTFANGRTAVADPATKACLTPGMTIPDGLWSEIHALGR